MVYSPELTLHPPRQHSAAVGAPLGPPASVFRPLAYFSAVNGVALGFGALACAEAVVGAELCATGYWCAHRLMHTTRWGWWAHKFHHRFAHAVSPGEDDSHKTRASVYATHITR